jgi:hypothetical protein
MASQTDVPRRRTGPSSLTPGRVAVKCLQDGVVFKALVDAEVHDRLAIHRSWARRPGHWTVTHVPTGYAIFTCHTKAEAEGLLRRIAPLDWDFMEGNAIPRPTLLALRRLNRTLRSPGGLRIDISIQIGGR